MPRLLEQYGLALRQLVRIKDCYPVDIPSGSRDAAIRGLLGQVNAAYSTGHIEVTPIGGNWPTVPFTRWLFLPEELEVYSPEKEHELRPA